jgi:hypothetical protein
MFSGLQRPLLTKATFSRLRKGDQSARKIVDGGRKSRCVTKLALLH